MPRGRGSPPWDVREVRRRAERAARSLGWTAVSLPPDPQTAEAVDAMCRTAYSALGVDLATAAQASRRAWTLGQEIRASGQEIRAMGEEAAAREASIADALRRLRNITVQMTPAKPTPFKVPLARCAHPGTTCPNNCQDRTANAWVDELSSVNYGDEWNVLGDL